MEIDDKIFKHLHLGAFLLLLSLLLIAKTITEENLMEISAGITSEFLRRNKSPTELDSKNNI